MHVGRSGTPACGEVGSCRRLPRQRHERSGERAKPQLDEVPQTLVAAGACCDATMPARHLGEFPRRLFQEILGRFFLPRIFAKIFAKSRFAKSVFAKDFCQDFWQNSRGSAVRVQPDCVTEDPPCIGNSRGKSVHQLNNLHPRCVCVCACACTVTHVCVSVLSIPRLLEVRLASA